MIKDFIELESEKYDEVIISISGSKKKCPVCQIAYMGTNNELLKMVIATSTMCSHSCKTVAYFAAAGDNIQGLAILNNFGIDLSDGVHGAACHGKWRAFCYLEMILGKTFHLITSNDFMLIEASRGGDTNIMSYLLDKRVQAPTNNRECFSLAARKLRVKLIEMFLNMDFVPPKFVAKCFLDHISTGKSELAATMLDYLTAKNSLKIIPKAMSAAIESKNVDALKLLLEKTSIPADYNPWKVALHTNSLNILEILISSGKLDVNYQDRENKETALHVAAELGNFEAVNLLCQVKGIKKDLKDNRVSFFSHRVCFVLTELQFNVLSPLVTQK